MGVGVGGRAMGVTVGGKTMGVGEGRMGGGVELGWGVTVGLGVAVGRGVGKVIGGNVGTRANSSRTPSAMRRSISCSEGPQAGAASISAAGNTKLSRHSNPPARIFRLAFRAHQCFLFYLAFWSPLFVRVCKKFQKKNYHPATSSERMGV